MTIKSRWTTDIPNISLHHWIFGSERGKLPDKAAFIDADRPDTHFLTLTGYRELSKRIALGLIKAGVKPGDRVLLFSGNSIYFPPIFLGILMAGAICTGANPSFVARELAFQLKDAEATFMIAAETSWPVALEAAQEAGLPRNRIFAFNSETDKQLAKQTNDGTRHWTELLSATPAEAQAWDWVEPADPANTTCCLNYSSGTTGVPKGVEISHQSYVALGQAIKCQNELREDWVARNERAREICLLPMYHAYAQSYFISNFPHTRQSVYVMPGFDFVKMLDHVQRFRITNLMVVPPILVALSKHPLAKKYDLSSLEGIGCGAAPLSLELTNSVEGLFPKDHLKVQQGWGMTETTCTFLAWDFNRLVTSSGVGEILANGAARIMEADGKTEIKEANKRGELWVSGPLIMRGYWKNPKATAETIHVDADGTRWLKTGDIVYVDQYGPGGIFFVVDRIKELIKVKGNQVAPAELEAVLLERPDIADAAVIGVTVDGEELPRAYIVKAPGAKLTAEEVFNWMATKVVRYKQLKGGVVFTDEIPKNPSGKILRKILRERAKKEAVQPIKAKLS